MDWLQINHEDQDPVTLVSLPDLHAYAYDHFRSYFHESRIAKSHGLREMPGLDLLSEAAVDWNPLEACWNDFVKVSEQPWIEDHRVSIWLFKISQFQGGSLTNTWTYSPQINGVVLFPGAGMVVMAVEAMKLMASGERPIAGYNVRDTIFKAALIVPDHERGVETKFFLRRQPGSAGREDSRSDFRLSAYTENEWKGVS